MSKFEVGAKVRFLGDESRFIVNDEVPMNATGVVKGEKKWVNDSTIVLVRFECDRPTNGYDDGWWVTEGAIELVPAEPKRAFAVGDKVRVIGDNPLGIPYGEIGVVTGYRGRGTIVRFDNHTKPRNDAGDDGWWVYEDWLELVPAEPERKFKKGDRVRFLVEHTALGIPYGEIGVVTGYEDSWGNPWVIVRFDNHVEPRNSAGDDGWKLYEKDVELVVDEPAKPAFNVGDRVVVKAIVHEAGMKNGEVDVGMTGEIVEYQASYEKYGEPFLVKFDNGAHVGYAAGWWMGGDELEAYVQPKFNVGDRVKFVGSPSDETTPYSSTDIEIGANGVIEHVNHALPYYPIHVLIDGKTYPMRLDELELIDTNVQAPVIDESFEIEEDEPKRFNVGDRVKVVKGDWISDSDVGRVGTITKDDGSDSLPYAVEFGENDWTFFDHDELELVVDEEAPKTFKVGDRVKATRDIFATDKIGVGTLGEVVSFLTLFARKYPVVCFDNGVQTDVYEDQIELVVEPTVVLSPVPSYIVSIDEETIKSWIAKGRQYWADEKAVIGDEVYELADWMRSSGDTLVAVSPTGEASVYRLKAVSEDVR